MKCLFDGDVRATDERANDETNALPTACSTDLPLNVKIPPIVMKTDQGIASTVVCRHKGIWRNIASYI